MLSLRSDVRIRCSGDTLSHQSDDSPLRTYLADLVKPFGVGLREDQLGRAIAYGDMSAELLGGIEPADLLVLAFAVPDSAPWGAAASRLSSQCPGAPRAFAVCDHGTLAGFAALRLIDACLDAGQRAMLVVAEQPAVGYELPAATPAPTRAAVVAFPVEALPVEEGGTGTRIQVTLHADVSPGRVPGLVAGALRDLGDATLVAGGGLRACPAGRRFVSASDGQPLTGVWWAAAELIGTGPLLLADYDSLLGGLALCAIAA